MEKDIKDLLNLDLFELLKIASDKKSKYARDIHICSIINAKSGLCTENCTYCAQSPFNKAKIEKYSLLNFDRIYEAASKTYENGIRHFGIVTSGYGYPKPNKEFEEILNIIVKLKSKLPELEICASLGILSEETVKLIVEAQISEYNHNLQVIPEKYKSLIATTHSIEERINTIRELKKYPIKVCSGAIIGLGETMDDRIKLAFFLKELDVDIVPINVLIPIKGTKFEDKNYITAIEVIKTFAIYRIILKDKIIKFAAGRETIMKDFQGLIMLSSANGFLTGGYLTTRGRSIEEDLQFLKELDFFY
ncbi:MAG: biotin synthase BioB [Brevinematales bacterium]|nr:biotin synthase BioB [Brevinematales bacterium]